MMELNEICPDHLTAIAQSGSALVMKNALLNVAGALRAARVTTGTDTKSECVKQRNAYCVCSRNASLCDGAGPTPESGINPDEPQAK